METRTYQLLVLTNGPARTYLAKISCKDYKVSKEKLTKILKAYFLNILKTEYLSKQTHIVHIDNMLDETSISNLIDYSEDSSNGYIIQDITNPENPIIYASYLYQVDEEGDTVQPTDNI